MENHDVTGFLQKSRESKSGKNIHRVIREYTKRLSDAKESSRSIMELFSPVLQVQRQKFSVACEAMLFSDENRSHIRLIESALWRTAFYDPIATAKKMKDTYTPDEVAIMTYHLNAAVGFYYHMISKIHSEHGSVAADSVFDFITKSSAISNTLNECTVVWLHLCLIHIGDLYRYKVEMGGSNSMVPYRCYMQAFLLQPKNGMPHNQMGTLAMNRGSYLDAAYHYMRCLLCEHSFEGTVNNVHHMFSKNLECMNNLSQTENSNMCEPCRNVQHFTTQFLQLVEVWYFNKPSASGNHLCETVIQQFELLLQSQVVKQQPHTNEPHSKQECTQDCSEFERSSVSSLNYGVLFKTVAICLLCISRLHSIQSVHLSSATSFTLTVYSRILQVVFQRINSNLERQYSTFDTIRTESRGLLQVLMRNYETKKLIKTRRRQIHTKNEGSSSDDSDENENAGGVASNSDEEQFSTERLAGDSSEDQSSTSDEDADNVGDPLNEYFAVFTKVPQLNGNDMLAIIAEESELQTVNILSDWFLQNFAELKMFSSNINEIGQRLTNVFNLLNVNVKNLEAGGKNSNVNDMINEQTKMGLPEDVTLKGLDLVENVDNDLFWRNTQDGALDHKEEVFLRCIKLLSIGRRLAALSDCSIFVDRKHYIFKVVRRTSDIVQENRDVENSTKYKLVANMASSVTNRESAKQNKEDCGKLIKMKHMGQLWLASEVKSLETRTKGKKSLPPYIVIDADALLKYSKLVKQLVHSKVFIVIVPTSIVQELDNFKHEQPQARDAIRWLENQFFFGNRFFRAQRPHESLIIPYIKYPKKKSKEMRVYVEIIECCHYLSQQNGASNVVTLLVGNSSVLSGENKNKTLSYVGIAASVNISIEHISAFFDKWKNKIGTS